MAEECLYVRGFELCLLFCCFDLLRNIFLTLNDPLSKYMRWLVQHLAKGSLEDCILDMRRELRFGFIHGNHCLSIVREVKGTGILMKVSIAKFPCVKNIGPCCLDERDHDSLSSECCMRV